MVISHILFYMFCVLSSLAIILTRKKVLFVLLCLYSLCFVFCYCSVALPCGAVGWSAVCGCGISLSYSLAFFQQTSLNIFSACALPDKSLLG